MRQNVPIKAKPMEEPIDNPRMISAIYFTLLSFFVISLIQLLLVCFGAKDTISLFTNYSIGLPIAAILGALFGRAIIMSRPPYKLKCFLLGVLITIIALLAYDFLLMFYLKNVTIRVVALGNMKPNKDYVLYLFLVIYTFILIGSWLSILMGSASIYLRSTFIYRIKGVKPSH